MTESTLGRVAYNYSHQGNFIELVHFRAETDEVLADHLQSAPRNALYTSKTIQNSLIDVVRQRILRDIVSEVNRAKYLTIIADEVSDLSNKEQLWPVKDRLMNVRQIHIHEATEATKNKL